MDIKQVTDPAEKETISRTVLEGLRDWFEIDDTREAYIRQSRDRVFFAAVEKEEPVGFLCLKETGKQTVELAVMGVLKPFHRTGIGRQLFTAAAGYARETGYQFMQVKTVQMGCYPEYDVTNRFYQSIGFKEFEVIPSLWGKENPCQIYVMALE